MVSPLQALRRAVKTNENFQRYYFAGHRIPHVRTEMNMNRQRLEYKPRPHTRNTAMKLKFAKIRGWKPSVPVRPTKPHENAANELKRAKENVAAIYGPSMGVKQASQLLKLAEFRAMRAIAKALASSPIMRRVEGRRAARNFIREELGLYRRPNSTVRPSNVKARRIVS